MKTTRPRAPDGCLGCALSFADSAAKPAEAAWNPKISENVADVEPATLRWLKQLGCRHVIFQGTGRVDASKKGYWRADDIRPHKKNCDDFGMILESMMIPIEFYWKARLGEPGRDQEIGNVIRTIQAVAKAGVPMMEWRFWPDFYWDGRVGYYAVKGRGEAGFRAFDYCRTADKGPSPRSARSVKARCGSAFSTSPGRSSRRPRKPAFSSPCIPTTRRSKTCAGWRGFSITPTGCGG